MWKVFGRMIFVPLLVVYSFKSFTFLSVLATVVHPSSRIALLLRCRAIAVFLQCFETVLWASVRASAACKKIE